MTEHKLKAERGLVYQQQEDGGWWVVASCLSHVAGMVQESYDLANLMAAAPDLLEACEAGDTNILGDGHFLLREAANWLDKSDQPAVQRMAEQLRRKASLEEAAIAKVREK